MAKCDYCGEDTNRDDEYEPYCYPCAYEIHQQNS